MGLLETTWPFAPPASGTALPKGKVGGREHSREATYSFTNGFMREMALSRMLEVRRGCCFHVGGVGIT